MTIHIDLVAQPATALLSGNCGVSDVEPLLNALSHHGDLTVELRDVRHLHAAIFQLLLKFEPQVHCDVTTGFIAEHLLPLLSGYKTRGSF